MDRRQEGEELKEEKVKKNRSEKNVSTLKYCQLHHRPMCVTSVYVCKTVVHPCTNMRREGAHNYQ